MLIDFMEVAGIAQREGNMVKLARSSGASDPAPTTDAAPPADREVQLPARSTITTAFSQPTEGVVQFHVSVKVD